MELVAKNYAEGLFLLAKEENKVSKYQEEVKFVKEIVETNPELIGFIKQYQVKREYKLDLIDKCFNTLSNSILNFLKLLVVKGKFGYILDIASAFNSACNRELGVQEGLVYSTIKLSQEEIKEIENSIALKIKAKVQLKNKIDSSLIGGIKIVVNDQIFDSSIRNRIDSLGAKILKEKR